MNMNGLENHHRRGRKNRKANPEKHTVSPEKWAEKLEPSDKILILACGALAKEIAVLIRLNGWTHLQTRYLPAKLHNTPEKIVDELRINLQSAKAKFSKIFIVSTIASVLLPEDFKISYPRLIASSNFSFIKFSFSMERSPLRIIPAPPCIAITG